jgi:hypothetical protein
LRDVTAATFHCHRGGDTVLLDQLVPAWHRAERHRIRFAAAPSAVWAAVEDLTWGEVPAFRALVRIRALRWGSLSNPQRILDTFRTSGFTELARGPGEVVFGTAAPAGGQPVTVAGGAAFARFEAPGYVKIAMNFRYTEDTLSTETRVVATDARARRRFAAYWFLIRPASGLIRRIWLRAIRRRCLRPVVRYRLTGG